jgi:hypothetical protein
MLPAFTTGAVLIVYLGLFSTLWNLPDVAMSLEEEYQKGTIKDPIEAIIYVERFKQDSQAPWNLFGPMVLATAGLIALYLIGNVLLPRVSPAYNFLWGDYVQFYKK